MHTFLFAGLNRLLFLTALCLLAPGMAGGAQILWTVEPASERLTITFSTLLPETLPLQISPTEVLVPLPTGFWDREAPPGDTDLSESALIAAIRATDQGLLVTARTDAFGYAAAIEKKTRTVLLDFAAKSSAGDTPELDAATSDNATSGHELQQAGSQNAVTERPASASMLRGKIDRGPDAVRAAPELSAKVRQPVSREVMPLAGVENATIDSPVMPEAPAESEATQPLEAEIPPESAASNQTETDNDRAMPLSPVPGVDVVSSAVVPHREADAATLIRLADSNSTPVEVTELTVPPVNATDATDSNGTLELEMLYDAVQLALEQDDPAAAQRAIRAMLRHPAVTPGLQEDLLYTLADLVWQEGGADLRANFLLIHDAYVRAKNFDPNSANVPEALIKLASLHLAVGNAPEAKGYFDVLRRRFPDDDRVPMIDHHLGEYFMRHGEYSRAADHFQYVIQNYPDSDAARASMFGLLRAMIELGYTDKAVDVANRIEKRWPKYHLETPQFLMAAGYASMVGGDLERAKGYFWQYVNLVPKASDVDVAMARIGDILVRQDKRDAAKEIYHRTAEAFPKTEGGLIALMRLAEEGVLDDPGLGDMDQAFTRPKVNPEEIYSRILNHPHSPLAPVARLKLAMWRLWNQDYAGTLREIAVFEQDYPGHELLPRARDVAFKSAGDWMDAYLETEDYPGVLRVWTEQGALFRNREPLPRTRLAVATAYMKTGDRENALQTAEPFVFGPIPRNEYSKAALDLTLALLVELKLWTRVLDLAAAVASWKLEPDRQRQVDYAAALAYETLGRHEGGKPLWLKLATDMNLTDTQRGYAHYFMARGSLAAADLEQASLLAQEALNLLLKSGDDRPKIMDSLELLIQAAERSGRVQDALAWSLQYDEYLTPDDAPWQGHVYRKALLYKKNNEPDQWKAHLQQLVNLFPSTLHGRMAAAELEGARLEKEVGRFR